MDEISNRTLKMLKKVSKKASKRGRRKSPKALVPVWYRGRFVGCIPYAGEDFTMYATTVADWLHRPVRAVMGEYYFNYFIFGDDETEAAIIVDLRPMTLRISTRHFFRVLWIKSRRLVRGGRRGAGEAHKPAGSGNEGPTCKG